MLRMIRKEMALRKVKLNTCDIPLYEEHLDDCSQEPQEIGD